jgi:aminoglycoside phosphotransferase (APT) family kinase protein
VTDFDDRMDRVLRRTIDGFESMLSVHRLSGGASQQTYRIVTDTTDGERVLALRRSSNASALEDALPLATEAKLMTTTRATGVPGPPVVHILEPDDGLGDGFIMAWVEGETIGSRINHQTRYATVRSDLARQCGEILARIHATDLQANGLVAELEQIDAATLVRRTWDEYRELDVPQPVIDFAGRWLTDHVPASSPARLVHGDFRNGNLIIDEVDGIVAVLDWELAHVGDPLRDLGWVCTRSWRFGRPELPVGGFGEIDDLVSAYEQESGEAVDRDRLRYWEVFGSFWWAVTCLRLADTYRSGSETSVERPAIGRRSSEAQIDCVNLLIPGTVSLSEASDSADGDGLPTPAALVDSVARYLRDDIVATAEGRERFLALVAANSLAIAHRELRLGPAARSAEHGRLRELFDSEDDLIRLRARLCEELREGSLPPDTPGLAHHLRSTAADQLGIDQPDYPGLTTARAFDR